MKSTVLFTVMSLIATVKSSTIRSTNSAEGCVYKGKWYPEGDFRPHPCSPCRCYKGRVDCAIVDCFFTPCVDSVLDPDHCCPVCPNGPNCRAPDGQVIPSGKHVRINKNTLCICPEDNAIDYRNPNLAVCVPTCGTKGDKKTPTKISVSQERYQWLSDLQ